MSQDQLIQIEVDGRTLSVRPGQMLIEATDAAGIQIPRFCYHKHLSIAANCRMCLVEVEKAPKPLPACATPCTDGMKVFTRSTLAREAQKGTMEFLLINHPLDCPICDQGGECELQDMALGYGDDVSRFSERKRVVLDSDIGPLVATDMTRCIHCTRCVRFGEEIAGLREMGATGRGEHTKIGTYIEQAISSELSGNIIDLCPVGALTSKPFRFTARAWELLQHPTIAPHDCVGSNLHVHLRNDRVMRVVPRENPEINETWLSDRDRYSYLGLNHTERLTRPMVLEQGEWRETTWEQGLKRAFEDFAATVPRALVSPTATLEEMYLTQKLVRLLGGSLIEHRLRQKDFRGDQADPLVPWLGTSYVDLELLNAVVLIGANVRKDQPLINHRLRKAAFRDASVIMLDSGGHTLNFNSCIRLNHKPSQWLGVLKKLTDAVHGATENASVQLAGERLRTARQKSGGILILLGNQAVAHPDFSLLRDQAAQIAQACGACLGMLPEAGNSVGAWLAGAVPHRLPGGKPIEVVRAEKQSESALLIGVEPDLDSCRGQDVLTELSGLKTVVALTSYKSPGLMQTAHVLLPMAPFSETSGTYINAQGDRQSFSAAVKPLGDARPGWKILRVLGNGLNLEGFEQNSSEAVRDELFALLPETLPMVEVGPLEQSEPRLNVSQLEAAPWAPAYACDAIVRRSYALQQTQDAGSEFKLHPVTAASLGFTEGTMANLRVNGNSLDAPVCFDASLAEYTILYPAVGTQHWGEAILTQAKDKAKEVS